MQFSIKNLGPINSANITLRRLNVIFGPNNSGKTYLTYAIWGMINNLVENCRYKIDEIALRKLSKTGVVKIKIQREKIEQMISDACRMYSRKGINDVFNCGDGVFEGFEMKCILQSVIQTGGISNKSEFKFGTRGDTAIMLGIQSTGADHNEVEIVITKNQKDLSDSDSSRHDDDSMMKYFIKELIPKILGKQLVNVPVKRSFAITSERTGVSLFYKNLDYNKSEVIDYIMKNKKINPFEVISKMTSKYAKPIQENIDLIRDYSEISKKSSFIYKSENDCSILKSKWNEVVGGSYVSGEDNITYKSNVPTGHEVPIHLSSSALKSNFLIDAYVKHVVRRDDACFIDEPELNLSAQNQVRMARFLVELSKVIPCVVITTHSDYIAREINLMINNGIEPNDVSILTFDENSNVREVPIQDGGFEIELFDNVISDQVNRATDE